MSSHRSVGGPGLSTPSLVNPVAIPKYIQKQIKTHEGFRGDVYKDAQGTWAWGWGTQLKINGTPMTTEQKNAFIAQWSREKGRETINKAEAEVWFQRELANASTEAKKMLGSYYTEGDSNIYRFNINKMSDELRENIVIAMTPWLYQVNPKAAGAFKDTFSAIRGIVNYIAEGHERDDRKFMNMLHTMDYHFRNSRWFNGNPDKEIPGTPERVRFVSDLFYRLLAREEYGPHWKKDEKGQQIQTNYYNIKFDNMELGETEEERLHYYSRFYYYPKLLPDGSRNVPEQNSPDAKTHRRLKNTGEIASAPSDNRMVPTVVNASYEQTDPNVVQAGVEFDKKDLDRIQKYRDPVGLHSFDSPNRQSDPSSASDAIERAKQHVGMTPAPELAAPDPNAPTHGAKLHQRHTAGAGTVSVPSDLHPTGDLTISQQEQLTVLDTTMTRMKDRYNTGELEKIPYIDWMRTLQKDKDAIRDTVSPPTQRELELRKDADSYYEDQRNKAIEDRANKLENEGDMYMAQVPEEDPSIATV